MYLYTLIAFIWKKSRTFTSKLKNSPVYSYIKNSVDLSLIKEYDTSRNKNYFWRINARFNLYGNNR